MRLVRSPGVASLAGGIGLDSALFSAFQAAILEPCPGRSVRVTVCCRRLPTPEGPAWARACGHRVALVAFSTFTATFPRPVCLPRAPAPQATGKC